MSSSLLIAVKAPPAPPPALPLYCPGYKAFFISAITLGAISTALGLWSFFDAGCDSQLQYSQGNCSAGSTGRTGTALLLGPGLVSLAAGLVAVVLPAILRARGHR
jgi:hypothetical protein